MKLTKALHPILEPLYRLGLYDSEMAQQVHCGTTTVLTWRKENNLQSNRKRLKLGNKREKVDRSLIPAKEYFGDDWDAEKQLMWEAAGGW